MSDLATLQQLNRRFIHNYVTNDVASHDAMLHKDFTYMSAGGKRVGRKDYLANWATGFDPKVITYWDMRHEHISVLGDTAIVRATNKFTEAGVTGMACYTDVYVRDAGHWLCVHAHIGNVLPEHFPRDETIVCAYADGVQFR